MYLLIVTILFSNLQDIPQNFLQIREEVTTAAYLYQPLYELYFLLYMVDKYMIHTNS